MFLYGYLKPTFLYRCFLHSLILENVSATIRIYVKSLTLALQFDISSKDAFRKGAWGATWLHFSFHN